MVDMLKSSKDEDQRKRDEAGMYSVQQQLDELRRQLKENLARQQWFEELYRQGEGKVSQVQMAQDRLAQDVTQHLSAREIGEGRMKAQLSDLAQRVEAPDKQIRELKAQIAGISNAIKSDRDVDASERQAIEELQKQIRDINAALSMVGDGQRQLRDLIHNLDAAIGEVRQEALHVAELQRVEEQRLRRQGVELQDLFEALRQQFTEVAAKSQRVDDVRRQLIERIEAAEEVVSTIRSSEENFHGDVERVEKASNERYIAQQERLEAIRVQLEAQLGEMRQVGDQRLDRYTNRFVAVDERMRAIEQALSEIPSRFEALERRDETIEAEADTVEEWLVMKQLAAMETVLDEVRKRRAERAGINRPKQKQPLSAEQGSIYNPSGLLKSVKDARPPNRKDGGDEEEE